MGPGKKILVGVAAVAVVGLGLWALGDLADRPTTALGVCPDTPKEKKFALAVVRGRTEELDAVERAVAALRAGRAADVEDREAYCAFEGVDDCERAPPDATAFDERIAKDREAIRLERERLAGCTYLR